MPPFGGAVTLAQAVPSARFEDFGRKTSDVGRAKSRFRAEIHAFRELTPAASDLKIIPHRNLILRSGWTREMQFYPIG